MCTMSGDRESKESRSIRLTADSIVAGHNHHDDWQKATPLPVVQPIYNTSIYFLPSSTAGEVIISLKVMTRNNKTGKFAAHVMHL